MTHSNLSYPSLNRSPGQDLEKSANRAECVNIFVTALLTAAIVGAFFFALNASPYPTGDDLLLTSGTAPRE